MSKRINIVLPDATVALLDRVDAKGSRVRRRLREQLKAGYHANAQRDLELAAEWFPLDEEAWEKFEA
jgi:5S rRNA maturation endonuclease (ribonuclease M5)